MRNLLVSYIQPLIFNLHVHQERERIIVDETIINTRKNILQGDDNQAI